MAEGDMFGSSDEEEFLTEILELGHNNGQRCSLFMTSMEGASLGRNDDV